MRLSRISRVLEAVSGRKGMVYPMRYTIPTLPWDGLSMEPSEGPYHPNQKIWYCKRTKWQTKPNMASTLPK